MKVSLNWLQDYVRVKSGAKPLADLMTMAGLNVEKIEPAGGDTVFEIEVTTNRPDWLSHLGVAREIHAVTGNPFRVPSCERKSFKATERNFEILTPDPAFCPYYSATLLEDVTWEKTPLFMKERLEACGIRSINLIVDITNYVLLEWGQPLHAFDADRLKGSRIFARRAKTGEKITAIDGVVYDLTRDDLIIADAARPVAIGGVMGGKDSEVSETTKNILLESAFFAPARVRTTARRLALGSESSYRFERRVDPEGVDQARERAVSLIAKYARVGRASRVFRGGRAPIKKARISLAAADVKKILGFGISPAKIKAYLTRLGLKVSGFKTLKVLAPSFRADLVRPIDLIEEIARLYGYDKVPETLPLMTPIAPEVDPLIALEHRLRDLCVGLGFYEAISFSLVEPGPFDELGLYPNERTRLVNPQNKELNLMRPNLLSGLAQAVRRNLYAGETGIRLFEIGNRYLDAGSKLPKEDRTLALILSDEGRQSWLEKRRPATFYDLKGAVETLFRQLGTEPLDGRGSENPIFRSGESISLHAANGAPVGVYGTLSEKAKKVYDVEKPVFYAELSLIQLVSLIRKTRSTKEIPKFPSSPRDLTLILDESVRAEAIMNQIHGMAGDWASKIEVFDYFKGGQIPKGKKSLSFRIFYQAQDRTLQNEEVNQLHFSIIDTLNQKFGAELPKAK